MQFKGRHSNVQSAFPGSVVLCHTVKVGVSFRRGILARFE